MATQKQFLAFLGDIEPSTTTKGDASKAHTDLRSFWKRMLLLNHTVIQIFYQDHINGIQQFVQELWMEKLHAPMLISL